MVFTFSDTLSGFSTRFEAGSSPVGFLVDEVALGRVFSEYFGFPCRSSFHQLLHNHHHHYHLALI
jgi:hypothetical protein